MDAQLNPNPQQLWADHEVMPFDIQLPQQKALWVRVPAPVVKRASFLDQRVLPDAAAKLRTPLSWLQQAPQTSTPLRWIFHCGHVGSTLLSRLLDTPNARVLREPQILRSLASSRREAGFAWSPWSVDEWWQQWAAPSLSLLARHRSDEHGVLIKATSATAHLMPDILQRRSQDQALALAMPLDLYLAAMHISPAAMQDIQGFAPARIQQLRQWLQRPPAGLSALQQDQLIAISWLVTLWPMAQAVAACPQRCQWISFADLMEHPQDTAAHCSDALHWCGSVDPEGLMNHYAKDPSRRFDSQARWRQLDALRLQLKPKAEALSAWLCELVKEHAELLHFARGDTLQDTALAASA